MGVLGVKKKEGMIVFVQCNPHVWSIPYASTPFRLVSTYELEVESTLLAAKVFRP